MRRLLPPSHDAPTPDDWARLSFPVPAIERPWIASNFVTSVDGQVAYRGHAGGIGSETDQEILATLRASFDAVLIGAQTLRAERYGPLLGNAHAELATVRAARGLGDHPIAVTITRSFDLPWDAPIFTRGVGRVLVATTSAVTPPPTPTQLEVLRFDGSDVPVPELVSRLHAEYGIDTLLCEGGPTVLAEFVQTDVLDELFVTIAPRLVGEQDHMLTMLHGSLPAMRQLELVDLVEHRSELFARWRVVHDHASNGKVAQAEGG